MTDLRDPLRARLQQARRSRDQDVSAALRSALAAIDNAEAVPVPEGSNGPTEVPRRELAEGADVALVRAEVADLLVAASTYDDVGQVDAAVSARRGAVVLQEVLEERRG